MDPNAVVRTYGADTLRVYEMFMGPLEASKPWSEQGVDGTRKWLDRVYRLATDAERITDEATPDLDYSYHFMIKKVTEDIETLNFNTAISQMMIFVNDVYKAGHISKEMLIGFIKVLSPFAPHLCEELHQKLTGSETIAYAEWPAYDPAKIERQEVEIAVQVNGKIRGKFVAAKDTEKETLEKLALQVDTVQPFIKDKTIRKVIVIVNKIVNIVAA